MAVYLGAALFLSSIALAQNSCNNTPIYLDFHDRRVDAGLSVQYGLFTGVGTPSQNLSQWPSLSNNEITIAGLDYCTDSPAQNCLEKSHGFYVPSSSGDYQPDSSYQSLDDVADIRNATLLEHARDTINLFVHYFDPSPPSLTPVPDVPITVLSNYSSDQNPWFGPAGLFGLGPSSTILTRLRDLNLISTRSYGLYMGTYYEPANGLINGSLTLGGWDSGRFEGEAFPFEVSDPNPDFDNSPLRITISSMTLTNSEGNTAELLSGTENLDGYLTSHQHEINLPGNILERFAEQTSGEDSGNVYRLPDDFNSTLTITLNSGLNITFEPEWLKNVSNNSPISTTASENRTISNPDSGSIALLGSAFFTHVYLTVNYDAAIPAFYLASALPHGPYVMTRTLCANTVPTAAPASNISSFAANGIVGAVIGGVVGGIGLTFLVWWLFRKWAQRRMWQARRRESIRGKRVEGGNVPIAGFKTSPKSFNSSSTNGDDEDEDNHIDERTREDSNELRTFAAFNFNDGVPSGYREGATSSAQMLQRQHSFGDNHADSPGSVLSEGYARLGQEIKPSVVQVQPHNHEAQAWRASVHDASSSDHYGSQSPHAPSPITPITGQPFLHGDLPSSSYREPQSIQQQRGGFDIVSPLSPPLGSTGGASFEQRMQPPTIQASFAPPPKMEVKRKRVPLAGVFSSK